MEWALWSHTGWIFIARYLHLLAAFLWFAGSIQYFLWGLNSTPAAAQSHQLPRRFAVMELVLLLVLLISGVVLAIKTMAVGVGIAVGMVMAGVMLVNALAGVAVSHLMKDRPQAVTYLRTFNSTNLLLAPAVLFLMSSSSHFFTSMQEAIVGVSLWEPLLVLVPLVIFEIKILVKPRPLKLSGIIVFGFMYLIFSYLVMELL